MGCGGTSPKPVLLRVAKTLSGGLRVDPEKKLPGRGAYVHENRDCIQAALKSKRFHRAFRMNVSKDELDKLTDELDQWLTRKR